jgi:nucleotide-binding universal stress UspA family protein
VTARRILFPFAGDSIANTALDAALRLARAEDATLVAAYLVTVPLDQSVEAPGPEADAHARRLLELIEQRAARLKVPVDSRIEPGRAARHTLHALTERERFDRIVIPAATKSSEGFSPEDIGWLLDHASGEIVVLRPSSGKLPSAVVPKPVADTGVGDDVPGM